jgi:hypothetical protein
MRRALLRSFGWAPQVILRSKARAPGAGITSERCDFESLRLADSTGIEMNTDEIDICSSDFWFKVVDFLQTNWALIEFDDGLDQVGPVRVWFMSEVGGIFDEIAFPNEADARQGLVKNGFRRFTEDDEAKEFLQPPERPFRRIDHPNGQIYSSRRFWSP